MLINLDITTLTAGVTQQPSVMNNNNRQFKEMLNIFPSPVFGCMRRPMAVAKGVLREELYDGSTLFDVVSFSDGIWFLVVVHKAPPPNPQNDVVFSIYDIETLDMLVTWPAGNVPYLNAENPIHDLQIITVADTLFILNKTVDVLPKKDAVQKKPQTGLIYVTQTRNNLTFKIFVNDVLVAHAITLESSTSAFLIDTVKLAEVLTNGGTAPLIIGIKNLNTELAANFPGEFIFEQQGNVIRINRNDGGRFDLATEDGFGDQCLNSVYDEIQTIGDLNGLSRCFNGVVLHVVGSGDVPHSGFFMKFETNNGQDFGNGVWGQTYGWHSDWENGYPNNETLSLNHLDESTLPHIIKYRPGFAWVMSTIDWLPRQTGNDISSPYPSFVSEFVAKDNQAIQYTSMHRINSIFFWQDRLGFLSGENIIFSQTSDYYNFWYKTATDVLDTDPIDLSSMHDKVNILFHAIPFNDSLLLCGQFRQFLLSFAGTLSPRSVQINLVSSYKMDTFIKPRRVGNFIVFHTEESRFTRVKLFIVDGREESKEAIDVTSHVPTYIPKEVIDIAVDEELGLFIVITNPGFTNPHPIFVYKYLWDNGRLLQSAWGKWDFPWGNNGGNHLLIRKAFFINGILFLIGRTDRDRVLFLNLRNAEQDHVGCIDMAPDGAYHNYESSMILHDIWSRDERYDVVYLNGKLTLLRGEVFLGGTRQYSDINFQISVENIGRDRINLYNTSNSHRIEPVNLTKRDFPIQGQNTHTTIKLGNWKNHNNFKLVGVDFTARYSAKARKM